MTSPGPQRLETDVDGGRMQAVLVDPAQVTTGVLAQLASCDAVHSVSVGLEVLPRCVRSSGHLAGRGQPSRSSALAVVGEDGDVIEDVQALWDGQAATFDKEADHGLRDPTVRAAWAALLLPLLPKAPATVADLGCGTGSLAVLLAEVGHSVQGMDVSPRMVEVARQKALTAGVHVRLEQGDAVTPAYAPGSCDVVLARHLLWALPDPGSVLARWVRLLRPAGILILIEGRWSTGGGISAADCQGLVLQQRQEALVHQLDEPAFWGRDIVDERYLLLSRR